MSKKPSGPAFTILDETILGGKKPTEKDGKTIDNPNIPLKRSYNPPAGISFNNLSINNVRKAFSQLYDGFVMTKTQNNGPWGIYKALVASLTEGAPKYLAVIVPNDIATPLGSQVYLADLPWISLQTRTTKSAKSEFGGLPIKEQGYQITRNNILFDRIKQAHEDDDKFVYIPDHLPLVIEVLKLKADENFATEASVISALELFQTIVTLDQNV
jgi:hypothetical protein